MIKLFQTCKLTKHYGSRDLKHNPCHCYPMILKLSIMVHIMAELSYLSENTALLTIQLTKELGMCSTQTTVALQHHGMGSEG